MSNWLRNILTGLISWRSFCRHCAYPVKIKRPPPRTEPSLIMSRLLQRLKIFRGHRSTISFYKPCSCVVNYRCCSSDGVSSDFALLEIGYLDWQPLWEDPLHAPLFTAQDKDPHEVLTKYQKERTRQFSVMEEKTNLKKYDVIPYDFKVFWDGACDVCSVPQSLYTPSL